MLVAGYVLAAWPVACWLLVSPTIKNRNVLVEAHLCSSPWIMFDRDWCVRIAQPDYLRLSKPERIRLAQDFFDHDFEPLLGSLYYRTDTELRRRFVEASALSEEELPVETRRQDSVLAPIVSYRDLSTVVHPSTNWILLLRDISLLALALSAVVALPLFGIATLIRWVVRGFRPISASGVSSPDTGKSRHNNPPC